MKLRIAILFSVGWLLGCTGLQPERTSSANNDLKRALSSVSGERILQHIKKLASDEFEGRAPGSKGEELTLDYLAREFKRMGLAPASPDGSYFQKVPLVGATAEPAFSYEIAGQRTNLQSPDDYVAVSRQGQTNITVNNSDLVFVGYGVVAPEYGWDDYKGMDVTGKTIVMLINDPQIADRKDPAALDERMFKGRAMTYYGRWTYKYEIAAEKGAAAAIIVHETETAAYPYTVVMDSWGGENFDIKSSNAQRIAVESWIRLDRAEELFRACGQDFTALKKAALSKEFKPVSLGARANFGLKNRLREVESRNVVARLEGSERQAKNEHIIYSAHWDHLGRNEKLSGDQIFNGAVDNASGVAEVLEIAEAFTKIHPRPKRSILFLLTTAEESGLLGAKHYAAHPLYPLESTLAIINMDVMNLWGRARGVVSVALGASTLDEVLAEAAAVQGKTVKPDPESEKGYFYRSDHFELAKKGVPALAMLHSATDYIGKPLGYEAQKRKEYVSKHYHTVSDDVKPDWEMEGAVEDVQLLLMVGYQVAQTDRRPEWKPGSEFKAVRETK